MKKIAILYICTGKYDVFWEDFYKSCEKYLLCNFEKKYFVFTDSEKIFNEQSNNINKIYQENLGWPNNTLMRFSMFRRIRENLQEFDYIFFFNANVKFIKNIGSEILPIDEDLVVVKHPGYYNSKLNDFPYERNKKSLAYIANGDGEFYVQGALNGGKGKEFIKLIDELAANIDLDLSNNIIATWHDESHLNRYIIGKKYKLLHPGYVYPEGWELPFNKEIITRNKEKWGGHDNLRNNKKNSFIEILKRKLVRFEKLSNKIKNIHKFNRVTTK